MIPPFAAQLNASLRPYTTLRSGGPAEFLVEAYDVDTLAGASQWCYESGVPLTTLGMGSNVLPSDVGVHGVVLVNRSSRIQADPITGEVLADAGCSFQELFLKCAQSGLGGLEFAVGIPGTLGGALVSNAGAYRSCVSEFLTELEVLLEGDRVWVRPDVMKFSYRDSILRRSEPPKCVLLGVRMRLPRRDPQAIYDEARDYQRQRISKQPPQASAGSFFKNVTSRELAASLPSLPPALKQAGVVPAGFLIMECGLSGVRRGGAQIAHRHANFLLNVGGATATDLRDLAEIVKSRVKSRFGVDLEEEVMYLGDWTGYEPPPEAMPVS